jgi:hypothetical protein
LAAFVICVFPSRPGARQLYEIWGDTPHFGSRSTFTIAKSNGNTVCCFFDFLSFRAKLFGYAVSEAVPPRGSKTAITPRDHSNCEHLGGRIKNLSGVKIYRKTKGMRDNGGVVAFVEIAIRSTRKCAKNANP